MAALFDAARRAPDDAGVLIRLAAALAAQDRAAEAVAPTERALLLARGEARGAALALQTEILTRLHSADPLLVRLQLLAQLNPDDAGVHLDLGEAYGRAGRPADAARHFFRALELGRLREANVELARLHVLAGDPETARLFARAALTAPTEPGLDPDAAALAEVMACRVLADLAEAEGDVEGRGRWLAQGYERHNLFWQAAAQSPFTILVLATAGEGNIPYEHLTPSDRYSRWVWFLEYGEDWPVESLPDHAVVLNAIGDPDHAAPSASRVEAFRLRTAKPFLNAPLSVARTARDRLEATLEGIAGLVVPQTCKIEAAPATLKAAIAATGLAYPLLVRPAGRHGGKGLVRLNAEGELDALAPEEKAALTGPVYVSQYRDYQSTDGYYRKYRMIFIDREPYPYHLAISSHWMVHHDSADMTHDAARLEEELAFLADPLAVLGAEAMQAITALAKRLDLDYGGVDFARLRDGRVLVFEANATMFVHPEKEDGPLARKNPSVRRITSAFQDFLARKAKGGCVN